MPRWFCHVQGRPDISLAASITSTSNSAVAIWASIAGIANAAKTGGQISDRSGLP